MTLTKENKSEAGKIFKADKSIKLLYVTVKGEFFTSENLCKNAVKSDKDYVAINSKMTIVKAKEDESSDERSNEDQ